MSTLFMISAQDGERHSHNSVNAMMNYIVKRLFYHCNVIGSSLFVLPHLSLRIILQKIHYWMLFNYIARRSSFG